MRSATPHRPELLIFNFSNIRNMVQLASPACNREVGYAADGHVQFVGDGKIRQGEPSRGVRLGKGGFALTAIDGSPGPNTSLQRTHIFVTPAILDKLELGYAVIIHKSQGSQWPTCFVMLPTEASRMIDQTLVYTAVTRPTDRLVLMGNEGVIEQAVRRGSIALERKTCLRDRILLAEKSA